MSKNMMVITAQRKGNRVATQQHVQLRIDLDQRIDILQVIRDQGLSLMFQPLEKAYGSYFMIGQKAGILLNSHHSPNLQRYTAAHEYGHHVMGHKPSIDDAQDIETPMTTFDKVQEIEAQAFAAYFLMPLRLVNLHIAKLHLSQPANFTAHVVYQLSLRLGVSYSALIQHLVNLGKIKGLEAHTLQHKTPKSIKIALSGGIAPQNPWADFWSLGLNDHEENILLYIDDEVYIHLPDDSLGNEGWHIDSSLQQKQVMLVREQHSIWSFEQNSYPAHVFVFRMAGVGQYRLHMTQSLETPSSSSQETFEIQFSIHPRAKIGLDEQQHSLLRNV